MPVEETVLSTVLEEVSRRILEKLEKGKKPSTEDILLLYLDMTHKEIREMRRDFREELREVRRELRDRVDMLAGRIDELNKRIDDIGKRIDETNKRIDELYKLYAGLGRHHPAG